MGSVTIVDPEGFRERLKTALDAAGTSAPDLERRLDLAKGTLTRVYSGRRVLRESELDAMASALGVAADHLLLGEPATGGPPPAAAAPAGSAPALAPSVAAPPSEPAEVTWAPEAPEPTDRSGAPPPDAARPEPGGSEPRGRSDGFERRGESPRADPLSRRLLRLPRRVVSAVVEVVSALLGR